MSVLKIRDENGNFIDIPAIKGDEGKSAYEHALEGGFIGTEKEFNKAIAELSPNVTPEIEIRLDEKADKATVDTALLAKADKSEVELLASVVAAQKGQAAYSYDLLGNYPVPTLVQWDSATKNTPYTDGLTQGAAGFAIVYGSGESVNNQPSWHTCVAWQCGGDNDCCWSRRIEGKSDKDWSRYLIEQSLEEVEQLRADVDYIAVMTGVEL